MCVLINIKGLDVFRAPNPKELPKLRNTFILQAGNHKYACY